MSTIFPPIVPVKDIDTSHPEIQKYGVLYDELRLLHVGGWDLKQKAGQFLVRHSKEIGTAYLSRANKVNYDNVLSTILSYYSSKLFETQVDIDFSTKESQSIDDFYTSVLKNCDRGKTSIEQFFERAVTELLLYGKSHYMIDLPVLANQPANLYEQKAAGGLDPYYVHLPQGSVQNWQYDDAGNYEWVMIHTENQVQQFLQPAKNVETWTYYDKNYFYTYTAEWEAGKNKPQTATLTDSGPHAMSALNQVPVTCIKAHEKLWFGNRIFLPSIEYFNSINSYEWSLFLAANPLPVITDGDTPVSTSQTVSEYAFMKLPKGATFKWEAPTSDAYQAMEKHIETLRESLFRMCHVVAQGRSSRASATVQSAISKEVDREPSSAVLNVLGDLIRNTMQDSLDTIALIRGEKVISDVKGMNFSEDGASATVDLAIETLSLNIPSPTLTREIQKKVARSVLRDANQELLQKIVEEIEEAPDAVPGAQGTSTPGPAPAQAQGPQVALNITERA